MEDKSLSEDSMNLKSRMESIWDFWGPVIFTIGIYFGIRTYLVEARYIPSGSMLPGLQIHDRLLVEKITFLIRPPKRGEIVVFKSPYAFDPLLRSSNPPSIFKCGFFNLPILNSIPGLSHSACDAYIKRVVAVAGDKVSITSSGKIDLNGRIQKEPYVAESNFCKYGDNPIDNCPALKVVVPNGHVLVLGDNRRNSWDGRYWPGSTFLPEDQILGRAAWRFWPLNRLGPIKP